MTETTAQFAAVVDLLNRYFEGLYNCDTALLADVFHPKAIYATASSGALTHLNMDQYFLIVDARTSPASNIEPRVFSVDRVEFVGPATAVAQVRMSMLSNHYIDVLTLLNLNGTWRIMSKIFHVESTT